jgi:FXSXX-COOH protein
MDADDIVSDLADLTHVPIAELMSIDHPILAKALQRAVEEAKDSAGVVAGFQAAL